MSEEKKIMEGVYFTDYRKQKKPESQEEASPIQLRATLQELSLRLKHLHYSNQELRKVLTDTHADDQESIQLYEECISENTIIIERDEQRLKIVQEKLRYMEMKTGNYSGDMLL